MNAVNPAKVEILARIRAANILAGAAAEAVPRNYRSESDLGRDELLALLVDRLQDYRAEAQLVPQAGVPDAVAAALDRHGARTVGIPTGLDRGLVAAWAASGSGQLRVDDPADPPRRLDQLDAIVTGSAVSCALTGTVFLDGSAVCGRRALTLVPDLHICLVAGGSVVHRVPEAISRLDRRAPVTLISGPSATSDIELQRVEGVHGPRRLVVLIVPEAPGPGAFSSPGRPVLS